MSENNVRDLFSEKDEADVVGLYSGDAPEPEPEREEPEYHAILKVWRNMLDPEHQNRHLPPTPDWCAVLIAKWPFLRFAECGTVQDEYFAIFDTMHAIIEQVHKDHPDRFEVTDRLEDVESKELYVFLLSEFQKALFVVQSEWSHDDPEAAAKMVALGEAQQQILGKDGLASYLGVINLPYTEEEQNTMNQELQEFRESLEGR